MRYQGSPLEALLDYDIEVIPTPNETGGSLLDVPSIGNRHWIACATELAEVAIGRRPATDITDDAVEIAREHSKYKIGEMCALYGSVGASVLQRELGLE